MPMRSACTTILFAAALLPFGILAPAAAAPSTLRTAKYTVGKTVVVEARTRGRSFKQRHSRRDQSKGHVWSDRETGIYDLGNGWIAAFGPLSGRGSRYGNGGP